MPSETAAVLDHVDAAYPNSPTVLHDITLEIPTGEHLAIIGRSGCGKSTLLHLLGGLISPRDGQVSVFGDTGDAARLRHCALIPQRDSLLPWFTVQDNVAVPLRNAGVGRREARAQARAMLARCGLTEHITAHPPELSGGMRQRVALARALLAHKPLLLADEPLGALDAITRAGIQDWLVELLTTSPPQNALQATPRPDGVSSRAHGQGTTMVMVTHDVDEALLLSHRVVLIDRGTVAGDWPGWFHRRGDRPREMVLANPDFATQRADILRRLGRGETR